MSDLSVGAAANWKITIYIYIKVLAQSAPRSLYFRGFCAITLVGWGPRVLFADCLVAGTLELSNIPCAIFEPWNLTAAWVEFPQLCDFSGFNLLPTGSAVADDRIGC